MEEFLPYLPAILSAAASLFGVLLSNKLMLYRIEQLEKKVDKHNSVVERTLKLETRVEDLIQDVRSLEAKG